MKRRTTLRVSLVAAAAMLFLSSVTAQTPEKSEPSVSPAPSSRPTRESDVPPEQRFIEISRTNKTSNPRRRPPSRRFRTSTPLPGISTKPSIVPESTPPTTEVPAATSRDSASQPPATTDPSTSPTPVEQRQQKTTNKVHLFRAAKSNRGQVFTFTFRNPKDNLVQEKQPTQSRIPGGFSPVFTSRRGSVPQTSSETNQPDNLAINSGPPGDIPRVGPSGREHIHKPSAGAGQTNQISQSQDLGEKTVPVNGDAPITERPVQFLPPSVKPKSKTRPNKGQVILPDGPGTPDQSNPPVQHLQLVIANSGQDLVRDSSSGPPRPNRPLKEQRLVPNQGPPEELPPQPPRDTGDPSPQTLIVRGQDLSSLPEPPRVRYVKAGSLRFLPNRPTNPDELSPQPPRDFAEPTLQTLLVNEGQDPSVRENLPELPRPNLPVRPLRPGSLRFLPNTPAPPEDQPHEPTRHFVEPTFQTLVENEERDPSAREDLPSRPLKQGSLRFIPNLPANSQELSKQSQDFADPNLQTSIAHEQQGLARFNSPAPPRPSRPLNTGSLRISPILPNTPANPQELPAELTRDFTEPALQALRANEGKDPSPRRDDLPLPRRPLNAQYLRFLANHPEIPLDLARQLASNFAGSTVPTLTVNEEQDKSQDRPQELLRFNRPSNVESLRFLPNSLQGKSPQPARDFVDPDLQILLENEGRDPTRFSAPASPRPNRPSQLGSLRFVPDSAQGFPQVARDFADPHLQTLTENEGRDLARFSSSAPPRPNRPLQSGSLRLVSNSAQGLPPQVARDFADPHLQTLTENEGRDLARFSSPPRPSPNRPLQPEFLRLIPNDQAISGEQLQPPGGNFADSNLQNLPVNGRRVVYSQSVATERLIPQTSDTPIRLQPVNDETELNTLQNSSERPSSQPSSAREPSNRLQPNQQAANAEAINPQPNVLRPVEQPLSPSTADSSTRVQTNPQTVISNPGFSVNPQTNIPRLIIEFPSPSQPGDSSIRLQLNPNTLPTQAGPANNPQPNIPRAPVEVPSSAASISNSNQVNQQALPANSGAAVRPQPDVPETVAQRPSPPITATLDPSPRLQPNQQALTANAGHTINPQSNVPRFPAPSATTGNFNNLQPNQQVPTNAGTAIDTQSNIPQRLAQQLSPATVVQPNPQLLPANPGPATIPGPSAQFPPALSPAVRNPSTVLPLNSQILPNSQGGINSLSKTLAFPSQLVTLLSPVTQDATTRLEPNSQVPATNSGLAFNSLSSSRLSQSSATLDSSIKPQLSSAILPVNQEPTVNSQPTNLKLPSETTTTLPSVALTPSTEPVRNSSNSQGQSAESKPPVTDVPSKSNVQVPPVDVRLTINFNSNIPGFPAQFQPTATPPVQTNNSNLNTRELPQQQPSPIPPNTSETPTRLQLQPVNAGSAINSLFTSPGLPVDLLPPGINSFPARSQQNFQSPAQFGPTSSPQLNGFPVTQAASVRLQPFSHFLNSKLGPSIDPQFNIPGRTFELRSASLRPAQPPATQDPFTRFEQNSQFLPANVGSAINSQLNVPGHPFQLQSQQTPTQDFLSGFQQNSQFLTGNTGPINSQFNNFGQHPSLLPPTARDSPNRATPQVFTTNTGLAVNNLSFSPGLSVELLPPVASGPSTGFTANQHVSTTNEEPPVNFLVNSPQLSADLLPPVILESALSSQPSIPHTSPQPPATRFSLTSFQSNSQRLAANAGRNFPTHLLELSPPIDPLFPQPNRINAPPNPIDIPKPPVPALVPPPREQLTIPIDIPKPAVPALIPPPREHINIPIDIPRPDVPALIPPPREQLNTPIDIPTPDVPALVPPPREHTEIPIDIPKPDVPALIPPPRPSDLARFIPPTPTTFIINPSNTSSLFQEAPLPNQSNPQSRHLVQTSSDNPVLILPKSNSRQQFVQDRLNNPIPIQDLSRKFGFLPQNQPAPFSGPAQPTTASTPTQTGTDPVLQITDLRAGRVIPIVDDVLRAGISTQPSVKTDPAPPPITFLRTPVHVGLEPPLLSLSNPPQRPTFDPIFSNNQGKEKLVQSNLGQSSLSNTPTVPSPTQTLTPPLGQEFTSTSSIGTAEQQTVNSVPKTTAPVEPTSTSQTQQTFPQPPQEGFIIFQTPTITVTSQSNRPDSPINVRVVTQGGTGLLKPNTTLTAEPVRPANPQTDLFIRQEGSTSPGTSTLSSTPAISTSTLSNLPINQRTSSDPSPLAASLLPPLDLGFVPNNFTSNPFVPPFSQSFPPNPIRLSNITFSASHGPGTACPKLDLQHKGHRAPQFGGNLILSPGFYPHDDQSPKLCDKPPGIEGKKFNWWQILLNQGGEPSTLSRSNESEDVKIPVLTNPCVRPLETEGVPVFYNITKTDSQTYYREEIAYHRFPEAKNTFLESRGLFIWKQATSSFDSAAFLVLYTRDDSGFWVQIQNVNCTFNRNSQPNLQCRSVPKCICEGGEKRCIESVPVLTRNFPAKTFRF